MVRTGQQTERFQGFPEEAIQFFLELQAEQSRTWFKAHQDDFQRLCRRPLELLVEGLQERLSDIYPGLAEVEPHYFRIQRDTRFARDKTPYKTWIAADLPIRPVPEGADEHTTPGLYVSFGLEGQYVAVGAWHMTPEILARYRAALDHPKHGQAVQSIVDHLAADGWTIESMESLKRVPPPFAQDHPRAELLKRKGLAMVAPLPEQHVSSPVLLDWAESRLRTARPLMDWLDRNIAAPSAER